MAERLTAADNQDALGNISQATILNFIGETKAADEAITNAKELVKHANKAKKDIRKRIGDSGIRLDAFDQAYADSERQAEDRAEQERHYRYIMAMLGKPTNGDESPAPASSVIETAEHRELRLDRVRADGHSSGRAGYDASTNPHPQGCEEWVLWQNGWVEGQSAKIEDEIKPPVDSRKRKVVLSKEDFPLGYDPHAE